MTPEQQRALLHAAERYLALLVSLHAIGAAPDRADEIRQLRKLVEACREPADPEPAGLRDKSGGVD